MAELLIATVCSDVPPFHWHDGGEEKKRVEEVGEYTT